jgi:antitoxin component of RelBE/YafQ-DinJ toxin-antitoxin module
VATRLRNIRVDDERWERWQKAARKEGMDTSEFVRVVVDAHIAAPRLALSNLGPPPKKGGPDPKVKPRRKRQP